MAERIGGVGNGLLADTDSLLPLAVFIQGGSQEAVKGGSEKLMPERPVAASRLAKGRDRFADMRGSLLRFSLDPKNELTPLQLLAAQGVCRLGR
jgi:hypothetical protein